MNECEGCNVFSDPNAKQCLFIQEYLKDECPCKECLMKTQCYYITQACEKYKNLIKKSWVHIANKKVK
jgi:hypothetical protein